MLEAEANSSIDMREFIPIEKVDPMYFESSYYLAPEKGKEGRTSPAVTATGSIAGTHRHHLGVRSNQVKQHRLQIKHLTKKTS